MAVARARAHAEVLQILTADQQTQLKDAAGGDEAADAKDGARQRRRTLDRSSKSDSDEVTKTRRPGFATSEFVPLTLR